MDDSKVTSKNLGRRLIQNYYQIDYPGDVDDLNKEEIKDRYISILENRISEYETIVNKLSNTIEAYQKELEAIRKI